MYEYEFRIKIPFPDLNSLLFLINSSAKQYTVKYIQHFRCKGDLWEFKEKLRQIMVYHPKSDNWIKFVESKEIPFHKWKKQYYIEFKQYLAFQQNIFTVENRYEIEINEKAKLYGYNKNFVDFGLVFELEIYNDKIRHTELPIDINLLNPYCNFLKLFYKKTSPEYTLFKCVRQPVLNTNTEINNSLKALKHDGIFGHVYSYKNYIFELWEDGQQYVFHNETIDDGVVFGAERLDNCVILLYVAQVRGLNVHNIFDILLTYLIKLASYIPKRYKVQYYYEQEERVKNDTISEGIIYHTKENKIYKVKKKHTIDLLYQNGFFVTTDGLIQCYENNLKNGTVYECNLDYTVIKPRYDRFLSNTPKQINQILKCSKKKIKI